MPQRHPAVELLQKLLKSELRDLGHERRGARELRRAAGDFVARAERAPLTREDHDPHRVVHQRLQEGLDQIPLDVGGRAVQPLGPVERDDGDARVVERDLEPPELAGPHHQALLGARSREAPTASRHAVPASAKPGPRSIRAIAGVCRARS